VSVKKKPEQIQVRVNRFTLSVKGHFDPERMEEASRLLGRTLEGMGAGDPEHPQSIQSVALLVALEKTYENMELSRKIKELEATVSRWDRFIGQLDSAFADLEQNAEKLLHGRG
jgi:cell division protein ZapA (FtsZ GTPase activity inhibitor)